MTVIRGALLGVALQLANPAAVLADTILFVGNSFTFGGNSPVMRYRATSVVDLNAEGLGGVPALFKLFTEEAGLTYDVSFETHPGAGLDWHWRNRLAKVDRPWDHVVLQSYSTLDAQKPGDPGLLIDYSERLAEAFRARNPKVDIWLDATWSRADLTYVAPSPWLGKSIGAMADDLSCAYRQAAHQSRASGVVEVGQAFNRAIRQGVAEANPYDGAASQIDLWSFDHYHASTYGYYLEALMIFGAVTGRDPTILGAAETGAQELGLTAEQASSLQRVAREALGSAPSAC
jgi:hypothetical protein